MFKCFLIYLIPVSFSYPTSKRALPKTRNGQQTPCTCKESKRVSVGSVCVLGEPWLELQAERMLLLMPKLEHLR